MGAGVSRVAICGLVAGGILLAVGFQRGPRPAEAEDPSEKIDPLSINAACYVCHMTFVKEELSRVHFKEKVTCIKCHGLSAGHANDEDVGATPPEVVFKRNQIDPMCRKCHEDHDVAAKKVIARFLQRRISPARPAVCTDCHGTHKIKQPDSSEK